MKWMSESDPVTRERFISDFCWTERVNIVDGPDSVQIAWHQLQGTPWELLIQEMHLDANPEDSDYIFEVGWVNFYPDQTRGLIETKLGPDSITLDGYIEGYGDLRLKGVNDRISNSSYGCDVQVTYFPECGDGDIEIYIGN